jgi:hypothetical protein
MLDLAIVTSCHNYGQYLDEWAASILRLTTRPARVAIVQHGSTDASRRQADAAAATLRAGGLDVALEHHDRRLDFGAARNRAVELAGEVEWVMHFDCDDMLMPHALDDVAEIAPRADVVALGYERCGDLAAGPRNRVRTYRTNTGEEALRDPTPCSGVSPFRRSFWLRSPYRLDQIGGWDTALWLGFAHLGARFVPTRRPGFWYRQHADSVFNTRRLSGWPAARTGAQLQARRRGDSGVTVVVPRAEGDGPERAAAWDWLRRRWAALHPDWQLLEGRGDAGRWCKGEAVWAALGEATGDVLVVVDADCVLPAASLQRAVELVRQGAPWVVPHREVYRLSQAQTADWLQAIEPGGFALESGQNSPPQGGKQPGSIENGRARSTAAAPLGGAIPPPSGRKTAGLDRKQPGSIVRKKGHWHAGLELARPAYVGMAGGGAFVVNRACYAAAGGIPRSYVGWGSEDEALARTLDVLLGPHVRLDGPLVHLWHPPQLRERARENRHLLVRLRRLGEDAEAVWAMVRGEASPQITRAAGWRVQRFVGAAQRQRPNDREMAMHDNFARRRLARARRETTERGDTTMAGALQVTRAHNRATQKALNLAQEQENQAAIAAGKKLAKLHPAMHRAEQNRRRFDARKAQGGAPENKMLRGAPENKAAPAERRAPRQSTAPAKQPQSAEPRTDPLEGVTFISGAAADLARGEKVTADELRKANPGERKFSIAMVREAVDARAGAGR